MLYFIPAWYKENNWNENEQVWYRRKLKSEFDETIKQITLFHRNVKIPYRIIVLAFSPNLRHFLHRQGMYRAAHWSCFDAMLQIKRQKAEVLSYNDMDWPEGTEFVYSPFAVNVFLRGDKYALIDFGENGNPISVSRYSGGELTCKNYYDDRGFMAMTVIHEGGKEKYRDYLMEDGTWKLRQYVQDGHVEVNQECPEYDIEDKTGVRKVSYQRKVYQSMEEVIEEVLTNYLKMTDEKDKFFVAAHELHMRMLDRCLINKKTVITFFGDRYDYRKLSEISGFMQRALYVIADSEQTQVKIKENLDNVPVNIRNISPYDTRMDFGISQQLKVQNILVPVDGIAEEELREIILQVSAYMQGNPLARVHLFTRNATWGYEDKLKNQVAGILEEAGIAKEWVIGDKKAADSERSSLHFYVDVCVDERTISQCINEQRVILDLRRTTDVYVFVTAISKGVPRISMSHDEYFEHGKNGYIINSYHKIREALSYYLDNFENWNEALVACYEIGQKYTTDVLLKVWREVLDINE